MHCAIGKNYVVLAMWPVSKERPPHACSALTFLLLEMLTHFSTHGLLLHVLGSASQLETAGLKHASHGSRSSNNITCLRGRVLCGTGCKDPMDQDAEDAAVQEKCGQLRHRLSKVSEEDLQCPS